MTDTATKVRSLFLTALMVVSVFGGTVAFAGGIAAANTSASDVSQGPVEYEDSTDNKIELVFDGDVTPHNFNYSVTDRNGDAVEVTNIANSTSRVTLTIGQDLSGSAELEVINGSNSETYDVTTTSTTLAEGSDSTSYNGERVAVVSDETDESFEVFSQDDDGNNDAFLFSRTTGSNSFVAVVDTGDRDGLSAGEEYNVDFQGSTSSGTSNLTLRSLGLSADATSNSVSFQGGDSATVGATISSNVANRDAVATLFDSDGDEVDSKAVTIDGDGEVTAEFDVSSEGNYTIEAEDLNTGITNETDAIEVSQVEGGASFSQSIYEQERGDTAEITVQLDNTDSATVYVGSEDVNYLVELDVTDDNDDGEVTVQFNTYVRGGFEPVNSDDDVTVNAVTVPSTDRPLDAGDYEVNVTTGGEEQALSTVVLTERSTDAMTIGTTPAANYSQADSATDVNYTEDSTIAAGDTLVHEVEISGVYGVVDALVQADNGVDDAEQALIALDEVNGVDLVALQTSDTTEANEDPKVLDLQATYDAGALNVYADDENNTLFVNVDTGDAVFDRVDRAELTDDDANGFDDGATRTTQDVSASAGDEFDVTFFIGETDNGALATSEESVNSSFEVVERTAEFDVNSDDAVEVESASNQTISGETSLAPGAEITVRARSSGDSPFLKTATTRVDANGTFSATLDFSNVSEDTNFTASVRQVDDTATDGIVGAAPTANVSISNQTTDGTTVTVDSATLSDGGFVTIHDGSVQDSPFESVRGTSSYLEAGNQSDIQVSLDTPYEENGTVVAMPHQDTNGNEEYDFVSSEGAEDSPYAQNGSAVTDSASLTVETTSPTPTPTTESPTTPTTEGSPATDGQPGFGAAIAIVALAGAALIALRRD